MENQHKVIDISEDCRSECEYESLHSYRSEEEDDKEIVHILRFEEKKLIYGLFRDGMINYNQLKEMLLNV